MWCETESTCGLLSMGQGTTDIENKAWFELLH